MLTLSDADRQAVDLFLESLWGEASERTPVARPAEIGPRIAAVSKLFDKLGEMATHELPPGLASRVMKAVERMPAKWQTAEMPTQRVSARQA